MQRIGELCQYSQFKNELRISDRQPLPKLKIEREFHWYKDDPFQHQ